MPSIVDESPYPWSKPEAQELHLVLARMYPSEPRALYLADVAGLDTLQFPVGGGVAVFLLWTQILTLASNSLKTRKLVEKALEQNRESPRAPFLEKLLAGKRAAVEAEPRSGTGEPLFLKGSGKVGTKEALLFRDDLSMPIGQIPALVSTLGILLECAPAVCLLHIEAPAIEGCGTGFRIGDDLILTNHHVLTPEHRRATAVKAEFLFEDAPSGQPAASKWIPCNVATIDGDEDDDWAVIKASAPLDGAWPILTISAGRNPRPSDLAFVIQHPQGARKRIAFVRNTITDVDDRVIHYMTDTQTGSSGSPVFDGAGEIIALHHVGGLPQEVLGKPPLILNEGVRITRVHGALKARGLVA